MKHLPIATVLALTLGVGMAQAAVFDNPQRAIITPQGARLEVQAQAVVQEADGQCFVDILLPPSADVSALSVVEPAGVSVLRWSADKVALPPDSAGPAMQQRKALLQERDTLRGDIAVLQARHAMWNNVPTDWAQDKLDAREKRLITVLPQIVTELSQKERDLIALDERIKALPVAAINVQRVHVLLAGPVKAGAKSTLRYTYSMEDCAWQPFYRINAGKDGVTVTLEAAIEQHSGFAWKDTMVTLSLQNTTQRRPPDIRPWHILSYNEQQRNRQSDFAAGNGAMPMASAAPRREKAAPPAEAYTSEYGAGWQLDKSVRVPEGVSNLPIVEEVWTDKLQRVTRPASGDTRVWLTVEHTFAGTPLPPGQAIFMLEGSPVGQGKFAPVGNKVSMGFGADPLCSIKTEKDARLAGKEGFIDRRKTWQWAWKYTVSNNRDTAVTIRIEDAAPQPRDKEILVTLDDTPAASKGEGHTLFWDVHVPAKGSADVRHTVRVEAPKDLNVIVGR